MHAGEFSILIVVLLKQTKLADDTTLNDKFIWWWQGENIPE